MTAATGKFYSNGLDLDWLFARADQYQDYVRSVHELLARMLFRHRALVLFAGQRGVIGVSPPSLADGTFFSALAGTAAAGTR